MAKIFTYTFVLLGVLLVAAYAGVNTFTSNLLGAIDSGVFKQDINLIFTLAVGASIIAGFYFRQNIESSIIANVLMSSLFGWILADLTTLLLFSSNQGFITTLIRWIVIPIIGGYMIAIIQWWRGNDI